MLNTFTAIEGNLAADVEVKENKAGRVYVDAVVLVNQGQDSNGHKREPNRYAVRITGPMAENAANRCKGDRLIVTGNMVTDSWNDAQTGEKRYMQRVLATCVGVSLSFASVSQIDRNRKENDTEQ